MYENFILFFKKLRTTYIIILVVNFFTGIFMNRVHGKQQFIKSPVSIRIFVETDRAYIVALQGCENELRPEAG